MVTEGLAKGFEGRQSNWMGGNNRFDTESILKI